MRRRSWPHRAAASRPRGPPPPGRPVIDHYGRLLVAALGFATLPRPSSGRALWALRFWLDSWRGIGDVERSMARQGYDLQLTRYDERGWRATFYTTGNGALDHERNGLSVGAHAVACRPGRSEGRAQTGRSPRWLSHGPKGSVTERPTGNQPPERRRRPARSACCRCNSRSATGSQTRAASGKSPYGPIRRQVGRPFMLVSGGSISPTLPRSGPGARMSGSR